MQTVKPDFKQHPKPIKANIYLVGLLIAVLVVAVGLLAEQWWQLRTDVQAAEIKLFNLQQQTLEYQRLKGTKKRDWQVFYSHGQMHAWLNAKQKNALDAMGINIEVVAQDTHKNLQQDDPKVLLLIQKSAPFDQLMQWLYQQQTVTNLRIHRLDLSKTDTSGQVSGRVELSYSLSVFAPRAKVLD